MAPGILKSLYFCRRGIYIILSHLNKYVSCVKKNPPKNYQYFTMEQQMFFVCVDLNLFSCATSSLPLILFFHDILCTVLYLLQFLNEQFWDKKMVKYKQLYFWDDIQTSSKQGSTENCRRKGFHTNRCLFGNFTTEFSLLPIRLTIYRGKGCIHFCKISNPAFALRAVLAETCYRHTYTFYIHTLLYHKFFRGN